MSKAFDNRAMPWASIHDDYKVVDSKGTRRVVVWEPGVGSCLVPWVGPWWTEVTSPDWTITSGERYGQPTWVEAQRTDGPYIIIDRETMEIMENGLYTEDGTYVTLPSDVADQLLGE